MKAIVMTGVGGPEVLKLADVEKPAAGPGRLLVRVKAAGVNPIDYKLRKSGALGYGAGSILGVDAAGIVESVGPGVSDFKPGDKVFYSPDFGSPGTYAQFHSVRADIVVPMPTGFSFEDAASLPLAGTTAWDCLFTRGGTGVGQSILVAGANGGVGSIALQLAKAAGAFVFATCSTRSLEFVKNIPVVGPAGESEKHHGPDRLLNYQTENWSDLIKAECPAGLDVVFDCVGQDVVSRSLPLMKSMGRIVSVVNPSGKLDEGYRKNVSLHYAFVVANRPAMLGLRNLVERRQLVPLIDSILPLEQVADAHRRLEAGGIKGKIVLRIDD